MIRWVLLLMALALPAKAQDLVAGLSTSRINISANFDGSEILIFGAIKRTGPLGPGDLNIIITVEGPKTPLTVRRKSRVGPIWINTEGVRIDAAPSFYAVNTTGPLSLVLTQTADLRHGITINRAIRSVGLGVQDGSNFTDAVVRIREEADLYQVNQNAVTLRQDTLFDTSVELPANLVDGIYTARLFLTRDGQVVSQASETIYVEKVGLEKFLYGMAHEQALLYALMSLAIAIAAGWSASAAFRYLQN
ncbi:Putative transmembrane protein (Alph_Pro_TM) [Rhodobacteraceae bacterium THAF1]|uniref:TIGR02186 family protein n=1 Tax=Palleronia sp. THAF1 TaxID=2587842 RepID=UPI000F3CD7AE|nr:TIGR02186 family protein [Palleronia sp. THAF1]QFU07873.1 Putative transmembrane protein [Palleronia sp. THAF1]VDC25707.1 Putative transmembrane protein (Alph_Pro_TM) [Rhodobacteraceae bacterium THAF1]